MKKFLIILSLLLTLTCISFVTDSQVYVGADEDMPMYIGG